MKEKYVFVKTVRWALLGLMLVWLSACATGPRVVDHAFSFDARWDSPGVEILNYRYGDSNLPGTRIPPQLLASGGSSGTTGISGPMPLGDSLYVKWRIKATGEVFEDMVDLKSRLPADITGQRIYFIVSGPQLYVYLIGADRLNPNPCPAREELRRLGATGKPHDKIFSRYCNLPITTLYPSQSNHNKIQEGE